jgi:hypothetical protein
MGGSGHSHRGPESDTAIAEDEEVTNGAGEKTDLEAGVRTAQQ